MISANNAEHYLQYLNPAQKEAVVSNARALLVLAGAGSGKTRVLVQRIAWLVDNGLSPFSVLAVTFTNKAAAEMRSRLQQMIGGNLSSMWVGTFHSIAHRLLRCHWREAGLSENFQIMDSEDQLKMIRRIIKLMDLDEEKWVPRQVQYYVNSNKDKGLRASGIDPGKDIQARTMHGLYEAYESACAKNSMLDFAELLLRALELWRNSPDLLAHYQQKFRHLLVDEFQDTNTVQYAWLKLLSRGSDADVTVVGDDDQSIYGWRGAQVANIRDFECDFPGASVVRLEQNYRSTAVILQAANAVIKQNTGRLGKNLWTAGDQGEPITLYAAFSETDEARYICERVQAEVDGGRGYSSFAILYRSNAQSRALEEALMRAAIPYRIYGGLRFFERAEIKNVLAYLRLLLVRDDDASFERVINLPSRGIGEKSLDVLRSYSRQSNISLWAAARSLIDARQLAGRASAAIAQFLALIDGIDDAAQGRTLSEKVELTIDLSGLIPFYEKEKGEKSQNRVENIKELISATSEFEQTLSGEDLGAALSLFLSHASLESGHVQEKVADAVQLMTLHSSKGLEFPVVFIVGLEEGLFPHQMSLSGEGGLEEERRLCYVGITRAKEKLTLSHAECRQLYGEEKMRKPSRFLREIPPELLSHTRKTATVIKPIEQVKRWGYSPQQDDSLFRLGQRVTHKTFGSGTVLDCEGMGDSSRVHVSFDKVGSKWLIAQYAKLEPA